MFMIENNSKNKKALEFLGESPMRIYYIKYATKFTFNYQLKIQNIKIHFTSFVFKKL